MCMLMNFNSMQLVFVYSLEVLISFKFHIDMFSNNACVEL